MDNRKRIVLMVSPEVFAEIARIAIKYNMANSTFVRKCVVSCIRQYRKLEDSTNDN